MKIAIMQPYIFPHIAYFQMINAVDKFIFYDDVNFIKQGWINRNKVLVNGKSFMFSIPLEKADSFTKIKDTEISKKLYDKWRMKFLLSITQNYKNAPFFEQIYNLILSVFSQHPTTISVIAIDSIKKVSKYLQITTEFKTSSQSYNNTDLKKEVRLFNICKIEKATHYINSIGGQELYEKNSFLNEGIELNFIKNLSEEYQQFKNEFVPYLSIIDVLMFNSVDEIQIMLNQYELIN
ncbi:WbqC family protein [Chryseobacterium foetidum]|uniref:WbqC family protein n=1 Tax=Chryseobacterium foetidum TaxID=2951057 RepID=UPI0021C9B59B|nr:WbqC family protein [Chryseobacterium foetidum]